MGKLDNQSHSLSFIFLIYFSLLFLFLSLPLTFPSLSLSLRLSLPLCPLELSSWMSFHCLQTISPFPFWTHARTQSGSEIPFVVARMVSGLDLKVCSAAAAAAAVKAKAAAACTH